MVLAAIIVIGGGAVLIGRSNPTAPPSIPGRAAPAGNAADMNGGTMPPGHPPIELPDDVKKTIADMRKDAETAPKDAAKWERLAGVEYRAGQIDHSYLDKADNSYKHVLELDPKNLEAMRSLGNIAFDQDQYDQAVGFYKRYLAEKPDDLSVQTDMATMYLAKGDADVAIQIYDKVLAQKPKFFQALFNLGIAYRNKGEVEKSVDYFKEAKDAAPDDRMRQQVDQLLARATGEPPPTTGAEEKVVAQNAPAPDTKADSFQGAVESIFRDHPMIGPKVQGFDWSGNAKVRVMIRDFPMNAMPDAVRGMFTSKIKSELDAAIKSYSITGPVTIEMVDPSTNTVMETVNS